MRVCFHVDRRCLKHYATNRRKTNSPPIPNKIYEKLSPRLEMWTFTHAHQDAHSRNKSCLRPCLRECTHITYIDDSDIFMKQNGDRVDLPKRSLSCYPNYQSSLNCSCRSYEVSLFRTPYPCRWRQAQHR